MSACAEPIIKEAVAALKDYIVKKTPQITFDEIKSRLVIEAERRRQTRLNSRESNVATAAALINISDWCSLFIRLIDRPEFHKQGKVLSTLAIVMDRLEHNENVHISEALEVFKTL